MNNEGLTLAIILLEQRRWNVSLHSEDVLSSSFVERIGEVDHLFSLKHDPDSPEADVSIL